MIDLNELNLFVKVASLGNLSAAARQLNIPVSTVSRKISSLEKRIGVTLIKRTTRKMSLTESGKAFYAECLTHLNALEEAQEQLLSQRDSMSGLIRITIPVALGRGEFIQFVANFKKKYPKLRVEIIVTNEFVDLVSNNVDIAIRYGALTDSDLVAKKLGFSRWILAASTNYLKTNSQPRNLKDLQDHSCVTFNTKSSSTTWTLQSGTQVENILIRPAVSANNFETIFDLVTNNLGIGFLPKTYLEQESGRKLTQVLPKWTSAPIPVHALYQNRKYLPLRVKTLLDELASWKNSSWVR